MLLLVIAGPACLPLSSANEQYFIPRLDYMRRKLDGLRTSVVQSQIWRREFVKAMQSGSVFAKLMVAFPHLHTNYMDELYDGCDACHMSGRMSRFEAILDGHQYDVATFEVSSSLSSLTSRTLVRMMQVEAQTARASCHRMTYLGSSNWVECAMLAPKSFISFVIGVGSVFTG
jgi:hypothetical protein